MIDQIVNEIKAWAMTSSPRRSLSATRQQRKGLSTIMILFDFFLLLFFRSHFPSDAIWILASVVERSGHR